MRPSVRSLRCAAALPQLDLSADNKSACITFFTYKNSLKVGERGRRTETGDKHGEGQAGQ